MKNLRFLIIFFAVGYIFSSCQKEGNSGGTVAVYTLTGSPSNCTGAVVGGMYTRGVAMTSSNNAIINVNVTNPGTYSVTITAVNGVTFTGTGTLANGPQTITLYASGTPTATGNFTYPITIGSSNCSFSVTFDAAYTIICNPISTTGIFRAGLATTSSNTVIISATSTRAGAYSITTPVVNGVSFSGSGSFTGVGTQSIILTASGTPTTAGQFSYNTIASAGGSNCNFSLGYAPPTFPFQFITATVGGVSKTFNTNIYAYFDVASSRFILNGENPAGTEIFGIAIGFSGGVLPAGTYNVAGMGSLEVGYYTNIPNTITYVAQTGIINPTPTFSVTLDNTITSTTHTTVTGSFSGAVKNASGNIIQITNGLFSVNL